MTTRVPLAEWLLETLPTLALGTHEVPSLAQLKTRYEAAALGDFETFLTSHEWKELRQNGLLVV